MYIYIYICVLFSYSIYIEMNLFFSDYCCINRSENKQLNYRLFELFNVLILHVSYLI